LSVEKEPPVINGQEIDLEITELSRRGSDGVAKLNGFVIFVPQTSVGDRVHARIVAVAGKWAKAEKLE
jgi:predicted RNA-binding protein with TRAM domain